MSRYRKTMRQAIEEGLSNMQIAILKKEYAPFKGKTISAARAKQLMNILDKFKEADLKKLGKETIPFVSSGARSKLAVRNMKFKVTTINPFKEEVTQEDFDLEEGKMKTIATMFSQGKSAEEIAKAMKLSVDTVKTILGEVKEENLEEAPDPITYGPDKVAKAMAIAVKSDGKYSQAVREIEKIGRGLSKVSTIARALKTANEQLEESAAASEIQKNNTRRDSMDYNMYKKTVELLKKKDYKALGKHIYDAETAPREYVMGVIDKKEPQTFKKMFGNQSGYYSLMKPLKMSEDLEEKIQPFMISYSKYGKHAGFEDAKSLQDLQNKAQKLRSKGFTIDKMGRYNPPVKEDKDAFDPITEACWVGYKKVGMKKKGDRMVPNCVPEEFKVEEYIDEDKKKMKKADVAPDGDAEHAEKKNIKEEDDPNKLANELKQKENEIAQLKQKAETDKAKNVAKSTDKMVNPETGEPLLQVGIAYKHLRQKMAKDAADRDDAEQKEKEEKKKTLAKFKDRIKEEALIESEASDKAKAMGLDYMKFGRYGKDGKVTHKTVGDTLQKVDDKGEPVKDDEPKKDEPSKDEPKADVKPKVDPFDAQKDLEDMVTDGMIDVEDDGQGGLTATKEYEPSQDYEAERDVKSIKQYFKDKGIDEKDIYVDVESEEDYIQVNVEIRGKKVDEDVDYLKPRLNPTQIANIKKTWQDKKPGDVTPAVKNMIKNMDIPTQLAIKHAKINQLSKLVEDLGKEDEPKVKKIITKLKGASQAHAGQAKDLEKAMKTEMKKDDAYAIGMAQAKKSMNDEPPLDKKTIKKGHEIADKILKKEETILEFSSQQIKQAYGIANDPRYKQGNYSGAVKAIEKLAKGLSSHPDVQKVLKRTNETMAAANAGAYRRGVDPSAFGLAINTQILSPAIADLISSDINTQLAELSGEAQYADLIKAGEIAKEGGISAGTMTMASGFLNAASIG